MLGNAYEISNKVYPGEAISHIDFILEELNNDWFADELIAKWVDRDFNNNQPLMYPRNKDFKFFLYKQV